MFLETVDGSVTHDEFDRLVDDRRPASPIVVAEPTFDAVVDLFAVVESGQTAVLVDGRLPAAELARRLDVRGEDGDHTVVFTAGSSGESKAVRLTSENWQTHCRVMTQQLQLTGDDRWLCTLPISHVGGLSILMRARWSRSVVILEPRFYVTRCVGLMESGAVTLVSLVPTMLRRILSESPGPFSEVRAVLVGGGPCPPVLVERATAAGLPVIAIYGMTETASSVALSQLGSADRVFALPEVELRIEESGRIAVRGPMVSPGYVGRPRQGEWLVTNDIGMLDEDGGLRVLGRADETIITGGEKVHPAEVAAILFDHSAVTDVAVVGLPDDEWGEIVAAVYTGTVEAGDLAGWLRSRVAGFQMPKRLVRVAQIPRNEMGKVKRDEVARLVAARPSVAPTKPS